MNDIDKILGLQIKTGETPSVVYCLFNADKIIKSVFLGYADVKTKKPADENTFYKAFSITKTFTALAVMQLAEQKKIDIGRPVIQYLPDFPYSAQITIKEILSHSAGIPNPIPLEWIHSASEHPSFNRDQFFAEIFKKYNHVKFAPNEKFAYSNLGYFLLGQLIEKVSGEKYETFIQKNILKKLDLDASSIGFEINSSQATGYNKKYSVANFIIGFFIDKSKYMLPSVGQWKPYINFYPDGVSYAGLIGKPAAFVKYIQSLLKKNSVLLSDTYKQIMLTENCTINNKPTGMCLGWFKGQLNGIEYYAHAGGGGGYYSELRFYPGEKIGSVIFFNRTGMSDERCLDKIDKYYFEKATGLPSPW